MRAWGKTNWEPVPNFKQVRNYTPVCKFVGDSPRAWQKLTEMSLSDVGEKHIEENGSE